jgi:hypothetical protein
MKETWIQIKTGLEDLTLDAEAEVEFTSSPEL